MVVTHRNKVNVHHQFSLQLLLSKGYLLHAVFALCHRWHSGKNYVEGLGVDEPCLKLRLRCMLDFPSKSKVEEKTDDEHCSKNRE